VKIITQSTCITSLADILSKEIFNEPLCGNCCCKNVFYKVIDLVDKWSKASTIMDRCMGMYPSTRDVDGSGQGAWGNDMLVD
jgi:hypothetical protein